MFHFGGVLPAIENVRHDHTFAIDTVNNFVGSFDETAMS